MVGGIFCYLHKAFNCFNYDILLSKLEFYGISGIAIKLLRSNLTNRYQRVIVKDNCLNKQVSEWEPIKHGVPQGSILGRLLFLAYINDLVQTINKTAKVVLFADDTSILITNSNPEEFKSNIDLVMEQTIDWFHSNLLSLNSNKTHILQFRTKKSNEMMIQIKTPNSIITNINFSV